MDTHSKSTATMNGTNQRTASDVVYLVQCTFQLMVPQQSANEELIILRVKLKAVQSLLQFAVMR